MNAGTYLTRIEIHFWQVATQLMLQSRLVQALIRLGYNVMQGKPWWWLLGVTSIFVGFLFASGFLAAYLIG